MTRIIFFGIILGLIQSLLSCGGRISVEEEFYMEKICHRTGVFDYDACKQNVTNKIVDSKKWDKLY